MKSTKPKRELPRCARFPRTKPVVRRRLRALRNHSPPPRSALARQNLVAGGFPRAPHLFAISETVVRIGRKRLPKPVADGRREHVQIGSATELSRENLFGVVLTKRRIACHDEVDNRREREIVRGGTLHLTQKLL